jgi:hypothetical protein
VWGLLDLGDASPQVREKDVASFNAADAHTNAWITNTGITNTGNTHTGTTTHIHEATSGSIGIKVGGRLDDRNITVPGNRVLSGHMSIAVVHGLF